MGSPTAFLDNPRQNPGETPAAQRTETFAEFKRPLTEIELRQQAARCMDCGVPFCQSDGGCPLHNAIPEWNDLVYRGRWHDAVKRLTMLNPFPEFTGRVCPALCEGVCVGNIASEAVTIRQLECAIIEYAFEHGYLAPEPPPTRSDFTVAIIGSGPAGLAAAYTLNRQGHKVIVFDRADRAGGLLMYGIPNMKLDKHVVQRRVDLLKAEGVTFVLGAEVGREIDAQALRQDCDAVLLACGSDVPRDLKVPGRDNAGIHFAMDYLTAATHALLDSEDDPTAQLDKQFNAEGKRVIVIGGGDTGNDCIGTALRQGCADVVNLELMPELPNERPSDVPWPAPVRLQKTDYGHAEAIEKLGGDPRHFHTLTTGFTDDGNGHVAGIDTVQVQWFQDEDGKQRFEPVPGTEEHLEADLVLLALGFTGPNQRLLEKLHVHPNDRGNIDTAQGRFATSAEGVFAAGDCRRGQSLVAHAIAEGKAAAAAIDRYLNGEVSLSILESNGCACAAGA